MQCFGSLALAVSLLLSSLVPGVLAAPAGTVQGDPQAITEWRAAMDKFNAARSWRSKRTFSASGQAFVMPTEFVAPDRFRIVFASDAQGRPLSGTVRIGNEWWSFGGGQCAKLPGRPPQVQRDDRESMQPPEGSTIEITKGGVETIDSISTQTYMMALTGGGVQGRQKMYVARDTGYPRRTEITTAQGGFTIDYADYDTPITINAPC